MKLLMWYVDYMSWKPTKKGLEGGIDDPSIERVEGAVAGFIHVEPSDQDKLGKVETKLVKNLKWLAGKWETKSVVLHSFSHLAAEKADPDMALGLLSRADKRLKDAGYHVTVTPYGWFNDLEIKAPGHPLARVFKEF